MQTPARVEVSTVLQKPRTQSGEPARVHGSPTFGSGWQIWSRSHPVPFTHWSTRSQDSPAWRFAPHFPLKHAYPSAQTSPGEVHGPSVLGMHVPHSQRSSTRHSSFPAQDWPGTVVRHIANQVESCLHARYAAHSYR